LLTAATLATESVLYLVVAYLVVLVETNHRNWTRFLWTKSVEVRDPQGPQGAASAQAG
jgi:hypothetical protein